MSEKPKLYNLFWYAQQLERSYVVALQTTNVLQKPPLIPAVILYPAFATPGIHVRGDNDDMFELLLVTPSSFKITPGLINGHLKISDKLDREKKAALRPLFPAGKNLETLIKVAPAKMEDGTIGTHSVFRGILSPRAGIHYLFKTDAAIKKAFELQNPFRRLKSIRELLGKCEENRSKEDTIAESYSFHKVRVHASCLEKAPLQPGERYQTMREFQDDIIQATLEDLNGPDLRGKSNEGGRDVAHGRGTHCFPITGTKVNLSLVDHERPILSYHPLFVYQDLRCANFGHVSDIHINARQQVLQKSPARVIEMEGAAGSPEVGTLLNVYSENLLSILGQLKEKADILLCGGDLVDHVRNVYPFRNAGDLTDATAAKVWEVVDLKSDYDTRYQAFVDHLTFYSILRNFYEGEDGGKPAFVITGNHDAYRDAYGISPRVLGLIRANEGIPADHNMTFYEAILAFGKTYGKIKNLSNFASEMFNWFYTVFTPFSDFSVSLPKQRVVGLAWGDHECLLDVPKTAHGFGHLPRADETASEVQLSLIKKGLSEKKKTVLMTHFTFVSYADKIANSKEQGRVNRSKRYTEQDLGTFQESRDQLYPLVTDAKQVQCVLSGHSHRKGLYTLNESSGGYSTTMHSLFKPLTSSKSPLSDGSKVPLIVSDSAGPLPRLNLGDELLMWGSDRPAGTLVQSALDQSGNAKVESVEVVRSTIPKAQPRLAVAMDYLHLLEEGGLSFIVDSFPAASGHVMEHHLNVFKAAKFPESVEVQNVVLYRKVGGSQDWNQIPLAPTTRPADGRGFAAAPNLSRFTASESHASDFMAWLTANGRGRFISVTFAFDTEKTHKELKNHYNDKDPWNFEAEVELISMDPHTLYKVVPSTEIPIFRWRESCGARMRGTNKLKYQ